MNLVIKIQQAKLEDCNQIAILHRENIPKGFLSQLGHRFLLEIYQALLSFPESVLLVAKMENDHILGFIAGCKNTKRFYKFFLKKNLGKLFGVVLSKLFSLKVLQKMFETASYPFRRKEPEIQASETELLSMAVIYSFQGKGLAGELFKQFVTELGKKDCQKFRVVVGAENGRANRFYQKMGCYLSHQTEIHKGFASNIYIYDIR